MQHDRRHHEWGFFVVKTYDNSTFQHLCEALLDGACTDTGATVAIASVSVSVRSGHDVNTCCVCDFFNPMKL
jgi:hypothetical protein